MVRELARVEALGGEGLMLRQPGSKYAAGRSTTLLKNQVVSRCRGRVLGHEAGGWQAQRPPRHFLVELSDGTKFSVGTGFSDAERGNPPPIGSTITFRYQELTDRGVPRFPSYVGLRANARRNDSSRTTSKHHDQRADKRRFEFSEGGSDKFWEIEIAGEVTVPRPKRTNGQGNAKNFGDAAVAQKHADKLIAEKTGKGYVEVN